MDASQPLPDEAMRATDPEKIEANEIPGLTTTISISLDAIELATLGAEIRALELTNWRFLTDPQMGTRLPGFASVLKLKGSELMQELTALLARLAGPAGLERRDADGDALHPQAAAVPRYLFYRACTIYGGSTEVQKDILAKTLLG